LLTTALEATGLAGKPHEWLLTPQGVSLTEHYAVEGAEAFVATLHRRGTTDNGVFGAKVSWHEPRMSEAFALLRTLPGCPEGAARPDVWAHAFPNHRHIFMTRRNKVRLAVSWWRAIRSNEWHRRADGKETRTRRTKDISGDYDFDAINALVMEAVMREAGIQAFFSEVGIVPIPVVYEDFVQNYDRTIRQLLRALGLDPMVTIREPALHPTADEITESWVQRFREERQAGWTYPGW
jgi:trehalose 2-sulfotransferase